jgi:hypothetical protein
MTGAKMTQKEAETQFPTAALREDYTMDLKTVLERILVLDGETVWQDESLSPAVRTNTGAG